MYLRIFSKVLLVRTSAARASLRNARAKVKTLDQSAYCYGRRKDWRRLRALGRSIREIADDPGHFRGVVRKTLGNRSSRRVATTAD
jgi:hypothetical protein